MGHTKCACPSHKSPEKVRAVLKAPRPCNVAEVRLFPVLVNYYYRLNQLLENNSLWKWTERCETAFHNLKEMITSEQILTHQDPTLPRRLPCDACPVSYPACFCRLQTVWTVLSFLFYFLNWDFTYYYSGNVGAVSNFWTPLDEIIF